MNRRMFLSTGTLAAALPLLPAVAAPPADTDAAFVAALPKAELHLHLEGTLEAGMKFALARRNQIALPYASVAELQKSYVFHDLPSFLKVYYEGNSVLLKEQDFYDLAYAYLARAASQNVLYAEMFFDPQQHVDRGIAFATVVTGFARAQADARRRLGIESQLILCFMRELSADSAMRVLESALPFRRLIVGVGLDSDEAGNPPGKFARVFARARAAGFHVTAHCDIDQADTRAHLRQVLDDIRVDRIDHGGNILQSPDLVAQAKRRGIAFTVCPVFSGWLKQPDGTRVNVLRGMLDQGLRPTISSDDPAYMAGNYILESFVQARTDSALTRAEMVTISRNAFQAAWLPAARRARYLARLDAFAREWRV